MMTEMLMDTLRALGSPNMDIRRKTLDLVLDLITSRNIDEVHANVTLHSCCRLLRLPDWHLTSQ